jgi:hypothetical protein
MNRLLTARGLTPLLTADHFLDRDTKEAPLAWPPAPIREAVDLRGWFAATLAEHTGRDWPPSAVDAVYADIVGGLDAMLLEGSNWLAGEPLSPRWLLKALGTNSCRRHLDDAIWVNVAMARIRGPLTCISDCRFSNELELLSSAADTVLSIRIVNPADDGVDPSSLHPSEAAIPTLPVDLELLNDHSQGVEAFQTRVCAAVSAIIPI